MDRWPCYWLWSCSKIAILPKSSCFDSDELVLQSVGLGINGTDRVSLIFDSGEITNGWLQVRMLANQDTGLDSDDVFYFGNAIGESGNSTTDAIVNLLDVAETRVNQTGFSQASIDNVYDFNRDKFVNLVDVAIARQNQSGFSPLMLITPTENSFGFNAFADRRDDNYLNSMRPEIDRMDDGRLGKTSRQSLPFELKLNETSLSLAGSEKQAIDQYLLTDDEFEKLAKELWLEKDSGDGLETDGKLQSDNSRKGWHAADHPI